MLQKIKNWLSSPDTPRWLIAIGFIASTLISIGVGRISEDTKRFDDNRGSQIRALQDSMVQFQVFASALSAEMFEKKLITPETRANMIKNLNEQFGRIQIIEKLLPNADKNDLSAYKTAVSRMIDATRQVDKLTEMSDFWTSASRLLIARNNLNAKLKAFV